jgi:Holliday junction resolvasome RuvABC DNA-binding subunit
MCGCAGVMSTGKPNRGGADATRLDVAELCVEAKVALKQMGWKPAIAQIAVRTAAAMLGEDATLEQLLVAALRQCPRPAETTTPVDHEGPSSRA